MLRLPGELRDMFREWLQVHYPDRLKRAVSLMQSMREGKDYEAQWGRRMAGSGPYAWMIGRRFEMAARRLGYRETSRALRTDLFGSRPVKRATPAPSSAFSKSWRGASFAKLSSACENGPEGLDEGLPAGRPGAY